MTDPLFGRAWDIEVLTPASQNGNQTLLRVASSDAETSSLRVTFDINQCGYRALWFAEVNIFNPNLQTAQTIVQGCTISVAAGYVAEGKPGEIFRGKVYQALWSKPEADTVILTLLCFVGLQEMVDGFTTALNGAGAKQRDIVLAMAANASTPIPVAYVAPESDWKVGALPRSSTVFGTPSTLFGSIANANDLTAFYSPAGLVIGKIDGAGSPAPDLFYAPPQAEGQQARQFDPQTRFCLIGTPQQTQHGAAFRVLLDSRLNVRIPAQKAKLQNVVIAQQAFQYGQYQSILSQDGVYFVAEVRFIGDTRGNIWESQVVGITSVNGKLALLGGGN